MGQFTVENALKEPITDPAYVYLNQYIQDMRDSQERAEEKKQQWQDALEIYQDRKEAYGQAKKIYNARMAELAVAQYEYEQLTAENAETEKPEDTVTTVNTAVRTAADAKPAASVKASGILPETGDMSGAGTWMGALISSFGVLMAAIFRRRRA